MNPEREKFLKIIQKLSRKYGVETEVANGNFVIVGRKPADEPPSTGCPKNPPKSGS